MLDRNHAELVEADLVGDVLAQPAPQRVCAGLRVEQAPSLPLLGIVALV